VLGTKAAVDAAQSTGNTALIPVAVGDGTTSQFLYVGPTVTKTDWQGTQTLYATARTNMVRQSNNFTATWSQDGCTATANQITMPDGGNTGNKIVEGTGTNGGGGHKVWQSVGGIVSGSQYTLSFLAKAGTRTWAQAWVWSTTDTTSAFYDLINGVASGSGSPTMTSLGSGWWLCTKTVTASSTTINAGIGTSDGTSVQAYTGDGASYIYAGMTQVEAGTLATSRIPTTTAAVTVTDYTVTNGIATLSPMPAQGAVLRGLATNAQSGVNTINDPDTLTTGEKPQIIIDYNAVTGENADLVAKANAYGANHSTYDTAYSALMSYLSTLTSPTAWNSLGGTTSLGTGNRVALWNPKWTAVKNAAADLRNAIAVGTAQNAISTAATDATNKANAAQLASQPHQVAWAYASKPALPNASYPAGYYAITTDARTVQVNAAGTAWTDVLVATTGLFGQLFANQLSVANFDNLIPNGNSEMPNPPAGSYEAAGLSSDRPYSGTYRRGPGFYTARIPCNPGDQFYAEAMACVDSGTGAFYSRISNADWSYANWVGVSFTNTTYQKVSFTVTIPPQAAFIEFYCDSSAPGCRLDNLYARRMADASMIVDGTLQALVARVPLLYSLDMRSGSDASGYTPGTATTPPIGFRISAGGFTSTLLGGATFTAQVELGYGVNLMGYQLSGLTARAMSAIGDNGQTGTSFRCFYRGSNDPGTNGGRPNISRLTVTPTLYQTASPYTGRLDLKLAPSSYTDNLDGLSYAKIELFSQSAAGTTAALTTHGVYYCPLGDRIYYNPTSDSDAGNASYATQVIAEALLSGVPACKVTLYGASGSSDTHCFYSASGWTAGTALTDNGTSWPSGITGAAGGGTGGGTGGGGNCPAPDVPLLMADGTEKPAGAIRIGDRVVAWDEAAGCECVEEVTHTSMSTNHRWLLVLSNGRSGRFAANHQFLLSDGRWQELQHLVHGDVLTNGLVVESARADVYGPVVKITINRVHTYTTLGVVSHNVKILS
jgi:hypothetical protein